MPYADRSDLGDPLVVLGDFAFLFDDRDSGVAHLCHPPFAAGLDTWDDPPSRISTTPGTGCESLCQRVFTYASLGWRRDVHLLCTTCTRFSRRVLGIDVIAILTSLGVSVPNGPFTLSFMPGAARADLGTYRFACQCGRVYRIREGSDLLRRKYVWIPESRPPHVRLSGAEHERIAPFLTLLMEQSFSHDEWHIRCACGAQQPVTFESLVDIRAAGMARAFGTTCTLCGARVGTGGAQCLSCELIADTFGVIEKTEPAPTFLVS